MKKRDYITAGAYYRLSKKVLIEVCEQISHSLNLPKVQSRKMYCLYDNRRCDNIFRNGDIFGREGR